MTFGDVVIWEMKDSEGGAPWEGVVIGTQHYAKRGYDEMVVLADEKALGMPTSICHCTATGRRDMTNARAFRERFHGYFPGFLKEES